MHYNLTVLIPTFNERENIGRMIASIDAICKAHSINEEILIVDDNSHDGTIAVVETLINDYPNVHLLIRKENPGLSPSLYEGMLHAQADLVQCIDCDFSHPPEKIPLFYYYLHDREYDMVIGSRYIKGGEVLNWPFMRRVMSSGAAMVGRLLIPHVTDSGSGFFAINRSILKGVHLSPRGFRMGFEILGKANWNQVHEIPITFKDREFGKSKLKFRIICDYLVQCGSILKYNIIERKSGNIVRAWKIFLHG